MWFAKTLVFAALVVGQATPQAGNPTSSTPSPASAEVKSTRDVKLTDDVKSTGDVATTDDVASRGDVTSASDFKTTGNVVSTGNGNSTDNVSSEPVNALDLPEAGASLRNDNTVSTRSYINTRAGTNFMWPHEVDIFSGLVNTNPRSSMQSWNVVARDLYQVIGEAPGFHFTPSSSNIAMESIPGQIVNASSLAFKYKGGSSWITGKVGGVGPNDRLGQLKVSPDGNPTVSDPAATDVDVLNGADVAGRGHIAQIDLPVVETREIQFTALAGDITAERIGFMASISLDGPVDPQTTVAISKSVSFVQDGKRSSDPIFAWNGGWDVQTVSLANVDDTSNKLVGSYQFIGQDKMLDSTASITVTAPPGTVAIQLNGGIGDGWWVDVQVPEYKILPPHAYGSRVHTIGVIYLKMCNPKESNTLVITASVGTKLSSVDFYSFVLAGKATGDTSINAVGTVASSGVPVIASNGAGTPTNTDSTSTDPTTTVSTNTVSTNTVSTNTNSTNTNSTNTDSTSTDSRKTDPTNTDSTNTDSTNTDSTSTDSRKTDPKNNDSGTSDMGSSKKPSTNVGAIVGGAVGGVLAIITAVALFLCFRRRKPQNNPGVVPLIDRNVENTELDERVTPFSHPSREKALLPMTPFSKNGIRSQTSGEPSSRGFTATSDSSSWPSSSESGERRHIDPRMLAALKASVFSSESSESRPLPSAPSTTSASDRTNGHNVAFDEDAGYLEPLELLPPNYNPRWADDARARQGVDEPAAVNRVDGRQGHSVV